MATLIPCSVDTTPMAAEIHGVSQQLKGTTAAVVTMQSAVIAAENKAANEVCTNVNRGFFTLIQSQISQKIANKQSRIEALLIHLGQQKRQLLGIKANMEREYGRIAERYLRIFTSVNKELESRIRQVDYPVFELVNKHMVTTSNRMNALSGWVSTSQVEGLTVGQQVLISQMKHNAQRALELFTDFLTQIGKQRVLTNTILIDNPIGNDERVFHIPVLLCETLNNESGVPKTDVRTPDALSKTNANLINNAIRSSEALVWEEKELPVVTEEFHRMLDASSSSTRVKDMMKKMFASVNYETL